MSGIEWLAVIGLVAASYCGHYYGPRVVQRLTRREALQGRESNLSAAVYFGLALGVGIPPIYLWRDAHWLTTASFILLGTLAGTLARQALFGKKAESATEGDSIVRRPRG